MIRDVYLMLVPELSVHFRAVAVRTGAMCLASHDGLNITSDYALCARVVRVPDELAACPRSRLSIVVRGRARVEDRSRRYCLRAGDFALVGARQQVWEAHGGEAYRVLIVDAEASAGPQVPDPLTVGRLAPGDVARLDEAVETLHREQSIDATQTIFGVLASNGLFFEPEALTGLSGPTNGRDQCVQDAMNAQLSQLDTHPAIDDVAAALGVGPRQANRRLGEIARRYALPWSNWRSALHNTRMINVLRLLSAPRATVDIVARQSGFRSTIALCNALARGGLPSPGVLARAARAGAVDAWTAFSPARRTFCQWRARSPMRAAIGTHPM